MCRGVGEDGVENQLALKQGGMWGSIYFLRHFYVGLGRGAELFHQSSFKTK